MKTASATSPGHCLVVAASPPHDVFVDLVHALQARGWRVTWCLADTRPGAAWPIVERGLASRLRALRHAARFARRVQVEWAGMPAASSWLFNLKQQLAKQPFDAILALVDMLPVGASRLLQRVGRPTTFVTLVALRQEIQSGRMLSVGRWLSSWLADSQQHPDLWRPASPSDLTCVVLPTESLRRAAVDAGLPPAACRVIPFGVPIAEHPPHRSYDLGSPARLLGVGRLSPEKGLHMFLAALPLIAARRSVHLTVIAAPGPEGYGRSIGAMLSNPRISSLTTMRPAQPRDEMIRAFDDHDLLLFQSVFTEPVAQIMLHAAAAGLPIVGPASEHRGSLLRNDETAACYSNQSPGEVAATVLRALEDAGDRRTRAHRLFDEVRDGHSLRRTIEDYDELLRGSARHAAAGAARR